MSQKVKYDHLGVNRVTRMSAALSPDAVNLDGRNFKDLAMFAMEYGKLLNYYDLDYKWNGQWDDFFASDPTLYLCKISSIDISGESDAYSRMINKLEGETDERKLLAGFERLNSSIFDQINQMNDWLVFFKGNLIKVENNFSVALIKMIEGELSIIVQQLISYQRYAVQLHLLPEDFLFAYSALERIWFTANRVQTPELFDQSKPDKEILISDKIEVLIPKFAEFLWDFAKARKNRIDAASTIWPKEVEDRHDFNPQVGLYLTFIKLIEPLIARFNGLTKKHLDFYFKKALKMSLLGAIPDSAYVYFQMNKDIEMYPLPGGTKLLAGKDASGNDIVFRTDNQVLLSQAKLDYANTLFIARNEIIDADLGADLITGIFSQSTPPSKNGTNKEDTFWPTFGEDQFGLTAGDRTMEDSTLGFAIASPVLYLAAGTRNVKITFYLQENEQLESLGSILENLQELYVNDAIAIQTIFSEGFNVFLSTEKEWLPIPEVTYTLDPSNNTIDFEFTLSINDPSITGYVDKKLKDGLTTDLPVLKVLINNKAQQYPYSLVDGLVLEKVDIEVNVVGLDQLELVNDVAKIKPGKPFLPFQPSPINKGSGLMIGSPELFEKKLESLSIDIDWFNLPECEGGFKEYYQAYDVQDILPTVPKVTIDNDSFQVNISALTGGKWMPQEDQRQEVELFSSESSDSKLEPATSITLDLNQGLIEPDYTISQDLTYSIKTKNGFLRLELSDPSYAFAQNEYPVINGQVALYNAKVKMWSFFQHKQLLAVPNTPFVPQVKSVAVNYSAKEEITNDNLKGVEGLAPAAFYQYGPFTTYSANFSTGQVAQGHSPVGYWFPYLEEEGHLLLGFAQLDLPQELTLLFQLGDYKEQHTLIDPPDIQWTYLANDEWIQFGSNLLNDGTEGFTEPGVVSLSLLPDMTDNNSIMPQGYFWIKISVANGTSQLSNTQAINLNAIKVSRIVKSNETDLSAPLPAGSIKSLAAPIPAVSKVIHPLASFGGENAESHSTFYQRVSESLRHKQRAICAWDYERMVLSRFQSIYAVKCINHTNTESDNASGSVLVTVVPDPASIAQSNIYAPRANSTLLNEVKEYLGEYQNAFVEVEITNPLYEYIQVTCSVRFIEGDNNGYFVNELNEALKAFISPWINGNMEKLVIGGTISTIEVSNMIERLPYVQFVTGLALAQIIDEDQVYSLRDSVGPAGNLKGINGKVKATKPWSVLTSVSEHEIKILEDEEAVTPQGMGIGNMEIDDDFIIASTH